MKKFILPILSSLTVMLIIGAYFSYAMTNTEKSQITEISNNQPIAPVAPSDFPNNPVAPVQPNTNPQSNSVSASTYTDYPSHKTNTENSPNITTVPIQVTVTRNNYPTEQKTCSCLCP